MGSSFLALAIMLVFLGMAFWEIGYKIPRIMAAVTGLMELLIEGVQSQDSPGRELQAKPPSVKA